MRARRSYRQSDIKRLFALSRNVCAYPMCEECLARPEWPSVQCQICHIYGLNPGSARYVEGMSDNTCDNLILLCPNHHNLIDNLEPDRFPPDVLLDWKHTHESVQPVGWPPASGVVEDAVRKISLRLNIHLLADGEREPIRSDPARTAAIEQQMEVERQSRDTRRYPPPREAPVKKIRVSDLCDELGMNTAEMIDLCDTLGLPVKTARASLQEPYADMVRRRAERDGLVHRAESEV